jgi:hypothetical protein
MTLRRRRLFVICCITLLVCALVWFTRSPGTKTSAGNVVAQPSTADTKESKTVYKMAPTKYGSTDALVILCCADLVAKRHWEDIDKVVEGTGGTAYLWKRGLRAESVKACEQHLEDRGRTVHTLVGTLAEIWKSLADKEKSLVIVDTDMNAPLSTFAVHSALPVHKLQVAFVTIPTMPRRANVADDATRVEMLKVKHVTLIVLPVSFSPPTIAIL